MMEVRIIQEDLSESEASPSYQYAETEIHVDNTLPLHRQQEAVIYEILVAYLDPGEYKGGFLDDLARILTEGINQLRCDGKTQ